MSITEQVDVAVVGSGPVGLAVAIELRRQGVAQVCVLERDGEAGDIPQRCAHPPFGLREHGRLLTGPAYVLCNVEQAGRTRVDIRLRHSVVALAVAGLLQLATPENLRSLHATRVLLATGARETSRSARLLGGGRPLDVISTGVLQAYLYLQGLKLFEQPLIVGTELASLSAVMSCRRADIRPVAMLERSARATARWPLSLFPRLCGVPMHSSSELLEIEGRGRAEAARIRLGDGRVRRIACDGILLSGRFAPESNLVRLSHLELDPAGGGPRVDQFDHCSDPTYFAAGNPLQPIETAGWSLREGRRIAGLLAANLRTELPIAAPGIVIDCSGPLKLCVPQRLLDDPTPGLAHLQLRVSEAAGGRLRILADGRPVWERALSCLPERRLLVPLVALRLPPDTRRLEVAFLTPGH